MKTPLKLPLRVDKGITIPASAGGGLLLTEDRRLASRR